MFESVAADRLLGLHLRARLRPRARRRARVADRRPGALGREHGSIYDQIEASGAPALLLDALRGAARVPHALVGRTARCRTCSAATSISTRSRRFWPEPASAGCGWSTTASIREQMPGLGIVHAYHLIPAGASKARAVARHMQARALRPAEDCIAVGDSREDMDTRRGRRHLLAGGQRARARSDARSMRCRGRPRRAHRRRGLRRRRLRGGRHDAGRGGAKGAGVLAGSGAAVRRGGRPAPAFCQRRSVPLCRSSRSTLARGVAHRPAEALDQLGRRNGRSRSRRRFTRSRNITGGSCAVTGLIRCHDDLRHRLSPSESCSALRVGILRLQRS